MKEDHRSYRRNFLQLQKESLEKIRACNQFNDLLPVASLASFEKALHRYRRGQGFESHTRLNVTNNS